MIHYQTCKTKPPLRGEWRISVSHEDLRYLMRVVVPTSCRRFSLPQTITTSIGTTPSRGFASTKAEAAEILDPLPPASVEYCRRLPRGFVIRVRYCQDSDRGRFPMKHVRYSCSRETENHPRSGEMPHCRKVPERTCGASPLRLEARRAVYWLAEKRTRSNVGRPLPVLACPRACAALSARRWGKIYSKHPQNAGVWITNARFTRVVERAYIRSLVVKRSGFTCASRFVLSSFRSSHSAPPWC